MVRREAIEQSYERQNRTSAQDPCSVGPPGALQTDVAAGPRHAQRSRHR